MTDKIYTTDGREIPTIWDGMQVVPPYRNKSIEKITFYSEEVRKAELKRAGYNTFQIKAKFVPIDLLTDSGTSAMSKEQWAAMMLGDEAYAGSESFEKLEAAVREVFGYKEVVPTHQGRAAERICAQVLNGTPDTLWGWIKRTYFKKYIPNNLYFTTSRLHQERTGAISLDVSIPEAIDPQSQFPWKGNIDIKKLENVIWKKGAKKIPFVRIEASLNMAGGQPFSMANLRDVSELCKKHGIFLLLDPTRVSNNAFMIQQNEEGFRKMPLKDIIKMICSLTDGCTMSSKKDHFVNIGGFFAVNDIKLATKARDLLVEDEGMKDYGGLAGYSMEAMAQGIYESTDEAYVAHYIGQSHFMGTEFLKRGVPIVEPIGVHGVFLDAKRFVPHIPQSQFPAQSLAAYIFKKTGIRGMERGIVSGQHGHEPYDGLELVRLTLPRRAYETGHCVYIVEQIAECYEHRNEIKGLRMVYEPEKLRFFNALFEPVE